jgi:hypothetical protein
MVSMMKSVFVVTKWENNKLLTDPQKLALGTGLP